MVRCVGEDIVEGTRRGRLVMRVETTSAVTVVVLQLIRGNARAIVTGKVCLGVR